MTGSEYTDGGAVEHKNFEIWGYCLTNHVEDLRTKFAGFKKNRGIPALKTVLSKITPHAVGSVWGPD